MKNMWPKSLIIIGMLSLFISFAVPISKSIMSLLFLVFAFVCLASGIVFIIANRKWPLRGNGTINNSQKVE